MRAVDHRQKTSPYSSQVDLFHHRAVHRLSRLAAADDLDADQKAQTAHVADELETLLHCPQLAEHELTYRSGVLPELFLTDGAHRGERGRCGERITPVAGRGAGRIRPGLRLRHLGAGEHAADWKPGTKALAHRHDVRPGVGMVDAP